MQERIRIPEDKMAYYKDLAEMYVGDDVSPDFYGWVFPKYDHVAVGARTRHSLLLLCCPAMPSPCTHIL
jgi:geranylgeranyl reductase